MQATITFVDNVGEEGSYWAYVWLLSYGRRTIAFRDLPKELKSVIGRNGWTRGDCIRIGRKLERELMKRGHIMEEE